MKNGQVGQSNSQVQATSRSKVGVTVALEELWFRSHCEKKELQNNFNKLRHLDNASTKKNFVGITKCYFPTSFKQKIEYLTGISSSFQPD